MNEPKEVTITVYASLQDMEMDHNGIMIHNVNDFAKSATDGWYIGTSEGSAYMFPSSVFIYAMTPEQ